MTKVRETTSYFEFDLKAIRKKLGLTLRELAKEIGCNYTHISHCEKERQVMSEELYDKIMCMKNFKEFDEMVKKAKQKI